jgi:hypothetical protein
VVAMRAGIISLIAIIAAGVLLVLFLPIPRHGFSKTPGRMRHIGQMLEFYYVEYGKFPSGDASTVVGMLKLKRFTRLEDLQFDPLGNWVDEWGTPIQLIRQSETNVVLRSLGPNKRDDGGKYDDIEVAVYAPTKAR